MKIGYDDSLDNLFHHSALVVSYVAGGIACGGFSTRLIIGALLVEVLLVLRAAWEHAQHEKWINTP